MSQKMRVNTQPKLITFSLKTLSAAVVSAVLFSNAYGAGLGKLTVLSGLGQPLHAEIELTSVSKEESGSLSVKLASVEAFRQANIEFNPALFALRFAVDQRSGKQFVRITSSQPVNEPFVDMLLELGGSGSRLVREYTFLLDPPDLRRTQPVQIATPSAAPSAPNVSSQKASPQVTRAESVPQPSATESQVASAKPKAPVKSAATTQPGSGAENVASSDDYQVKAGDTLAKIAGMYKREGISLDQMLVGLQRANPNAFIGNNINRLRSGQILTIPDAETARGIPASEAKSIVVAQSVDFNSYRNKLAEQTLNAAPQKSDEAKQSATGKITAKVEEQPTAANEAKDKLKLSRSGAAAAGADKGSNSAAFAEERIAKDKALAEANARVKELEKNVTDLQKILEIKNKDLAERQKQADAAKLNPVPAAPAPSAASTAAPVPPSTAVSAKPATAPTTAPVSGNAPAPSTSPAVATVPPVTPSATAAPTDSPAANTAVPAPALNSSVASTPDAPKPADVQPVTPSPAKPAVTTAKTQPVIPAAPAETSLLDDVLENPLMLGLLGALLAGLGGLGIYSARRKKKLQSDFNNSNLLADSSNLTANSLFGSTGGQSVDTNNSVFNSNFAPSASQLDTNEVDPVAEADVYIAYGRDAQAEEILKEALRTQPDRNAVRVKLLEIYANRKDLRAFELLASELYSITKGEGDDWEQAAGLGVEIDPQNPLYAGGKPPDSVVAKTAALTAPTQPLDELNLDALLNTTQTSTPSLENLDTVESSPSYFDNTVGSAASGLPDLDMQAPSPAAEVFSMPSEPVKPKKETPPAPLVEAEAPVGLDFDFDLPGLGIKEPEQTKSTDAPKSSAQADTTDNGLDFDFNLESFAAKLPPEVKAAPVEETPSMDAENFASFDLNDSPAFEKSNSTPAGATAPATPDFDLSGISLDLAPAESMATVSAPAHEADGDSNLAEMATKLDLAIAYQEIGDREGARELLDEVVKGGTSEQTEKAKSLLQKIA